MKSCPMVSTVSLDLPWDRCRCDFRPLKPWKLQPLPTKTQLLSRLWVAVLQEVLHVLFKFVAIAAAGDVLDLSGLCFWATKHLQIPWLSWKRFTAASYTIPCNMYCRQQSQLHFSMLNLSASCDISWNFLKTSSKKLPKISGTHASHRHPPWHKPLLQWTWHTSTWSIPSRTVAYLLLL